MVQNHTLNYMFLDRLRCDCEYVTHWGYGCINRLYYGNIKRHIEEMLKLYKILPEKPKWLTLRKIKRYYNKLIRITQQTEEQQQLNRLKVTRTV